MGLSVDDFKSRQRRGLPCSVATALDALDPKVRKVFVEAMALPIGEVLHVKVVDLFKEHGQDVPVLQVGKHRRGKCACA